MSVPRLDRDEPEIGWARLLGAVLAAVTLTRFLHDLRRGRFRWR